MKKSLGLLVVILMCTFLACVANADTTAFVTTTTAGVREVPDTEADTIVSLKNGETMTVVEVVYGVGGEVFCKVPLASLNKGVETVDEYGNERFGYVVQNYVAMGDKNYITLTHDTKIWAFPDSSMCVGMKNGGTKMLLLGVYTDTWGHDWFVVQMQDKAGGSGFIRVEELGEWSYQSQQAQQQAVLPVIETPAETYNPAIDTQPETIQQEGNRVPDTIPASNNALPYMAMVNCNTLAVRATPLDESEPIGYIHYGDVAKVKEIGDYFTVIEFTTKAGVTVDGYVHTWWNSTNTLLKVN